MARIAGINVPDHKHAVIALTAIYGIGRQTASEICSEVGVLPSVKIKDLAEEKIEAIRNVIAKMTVEGDLRREVSRQPSSKIESNQQPSYDGGACQAESASSQQQPEHPTTAEQQP